MNSDDSEVRTMKQPECENQLTLFVYTVHDIYHIEGLKAKQCDVILR